MKESTIYEEKLKKANNELNALYEEIKKDHIRLGNDNFEDNEWKDIKNKICTHITAYKKTVEETKKNLNIAKGIKDIDKTIIKNVEINLIEEEIVNRKIQYMKERIELLDKKV